MAEGGRLGRDLRVRIGLALLAVITAAALFAPALSPVNPDAQRDVAATRFLAPLTSDAHGVFHPLGTDRLGRDVWARLVYGARVSLLVGALAMAVSLLIGIAVGATAAAATAGPRGLSALLLGATDFFISVCLSSATFA